MRTCKKIVAVDVWDVAVAEMCLKSECCVVYYLVVFILSLIDVAATTHTVLYRFVSSTVCEFVSLCFAD